jgi:hypothetical protein
MAPPTKRTGGFDRREGLAFDDKLSGGGRTALEALRATH